MALRESEVRLAASDMVHFHTNEHVQAWVLLCLKDPLDLFVVAKRAEADPLSLQANARGGRKDEAEEEQPVDENGGNTVMVEVEAGNELGPVLSPSLVPSLFPVPSERESVPPPPETEKRVLAPEEEGGGVMRPFFFFSFINLSILSGEGGQGLRRLFFYFFFYQFINSFVSIN